jgi:ribosomal protein L18
MLWRLMLMSISALSSNLIADLSQQYQQNPFQKIQQDFKQLASDLQSGDLSGAQSAYASIEQLLPANQSSSGSATGSNGSSAIQSDFASLGQALQSGDLSGAQSAFSQLQSDLQTAAQSAQTPPQAEDQYVGRSSQQGLSVAKQVQQDYAQLASSLQSDDLAGAQSAFTNLQQALQSQGTSTTQSSTARPGALIGKFEPGAERVFSTSDRHSVYPASRDIAEPKPDATTAGAPAGTAKLDLDDGLRERFSYH